MDILRPCYLHNGISYTGKRTSLYWIGAQVMQIWFSGSYPSWVLHSKLYVLSWLAGTQPRLLRSTLAMVLAPSNIIKYWSQYFKWMAESSVNQHAEGRVIWTPNVSMTMYQPSRCLGAVSIRKTVLPGMAIPMLKKRRPNGRLIFNMEIAIRR